MRQACFRLARAFATKSKGGGAAASSNDVRGATAQSLFSLEASQRRYDTVLDAFQRELGKLRVGRATQGLLDHILVPLPSRPAAPLPSLCSVSVQDVQTLRLNLYDPSMASALEAALRASPLKLSPRVAEGGSQTVLVSVPPPSEETRQRVLKLVKEAGETARAAGRRVRQDSFDAVRSSGKAGASKDDVKRMEVKLQVQADAFVKSLTSLVAAKEKEAA